jgi:hypothetical protein
MCIRYAKSWQLIYLNLNYTVPVQCNLSSYHLSAMPFTAWQRCLPPHLATAKLRCKRLARRQNSSAPKMAELKLHCTRMVIEITYFKKVACIWIDSQMKLSPGTPHTPAVFTALPLTFAIDLDSGRVYSNRY